MIRTAIFVIDIQNDLAGDPETEIPSAQRIRDAANIIIDKAREVIEHHVQLKNLSPITLVFVQHEETPDKGPLIRGSKPWELVFRPDDSSPYEQLVSKTTHNTFESNLRLAEELKEQNIGKIVAFGIQSECCVLDTAKGALGAGFDVTLLAGAHSTYDREGYKAEAIEQDVEIELRGLGAHLTPFADYISALASA